MLKGWNVLKLQSGDGGDGPHTILRQAQDDITLQNQMSKKDGI